MTPDQIRAAITRFERRIEELKRLDITTIKSSDDPLLTFDREYDHRLLPTG
jgi:hypothetical protein